MIEYLFDLKRLEKKPSLTFLWAIIVNSVAIVAATQVTSIPGIDLGFFSVLFTIIPSVYFITLLINREELMDEKAIQKGSHSLWENHGKDIMVLLFYFFGVAVSFALWAFALPGGFDTQLEKINAIRGTGDITQAGAFQSILLNNFQVMIVAFIFSLVFGAGAIFIIVWNASVLGVFIGEISRSVWEIPLVSAGFLPHGIPEIGGYLLAGLAGGILSAAILRRRRRILKYILFDSLRLLTLGVLLIALGSAIEVYV